MKATWQPAWYGLDQALALGAVQQYGFVRQPTSIQETRNPRMFATGLTADADLVLAKALVSRIHHRLLGELQGVATEGLSYTFILLDGTAIRVDAEHSPGLVEGVTGMAPVGEGNQLPDWLLEVDLVPQRE